jgi:hypothetical protein
MFFFILSVASIIIGLKSYKKILDKKKVNLDLK